MTIVKTYCDHCGKEVHDMTDYISCEIEIGHNEIEADLCRDCFEELTEAVKGFCICGESKDDGRPAV